MARPRPMWTTLTVAAFLVGGAASYCVDLRAAPRLALAAEEKGAPPEEKGEPAEPKLRAPTDAERKAATASIEAQLKAFKADDYEKAAKYQSAGLRDQFRTVEEFRRAIREGYPQFANYKSVTFGEARCDEKGDALQIQATVTGQDGVTVRGVYIMVREEGEYRVTSVFGGMRVKPSPKDIV